MQYMNRRLRNTILIVVMLFGTLFSLLSMLSINSYGNALREAIIGEITNETANSANQMSSVLENAEGTVNAMSAAVTSTFDMEKYRADPKYVDQYIKRFDPVLYNSIKDLQNTVGLFFTFDVDLVGQKEGGLDEQGKPCNTMTTEQETRLVDLFRNLKILFPKAKIVGHRDLPGTTPKECPCLDAGSWSAHHHLD